MSLLAVAGTNSVSGGYDIANSLKLEADNGEVLTQTIGAGSRTTATYSFWFKRTELGAGMQIAGISPIGSETTRFIINSNDTLDVESGVGGDNNSLVTNRVFRDTSAWYHFVVAIDTTQATEANRVKVYVNGVQETSFSASEYPAQNTNLTIGVSGYTWSWGAYTSTQIQSSGYLAEAYYIDAQQLDPTSFGEFDEDTGIWKPIAYTGSFGSNGHYLDFSDASNLGNNSSGVGNDFTLNNITSADQATDTPTNNFCTMNMLDRTDGNSKNQEGATKVTTDGGSGWCSMIATMGVTKGKWYWETQRSGGSTDSNDVVVGIAGSEDPYIPYNSAAKYYIGNVATSSSMGFYTTGVPNVRNGSGDSLSNSAGDIIMIGLDVDNSKLYFGVNGTFYQLGTGGSTIWSSFDDQFIMPAVAVYQGKQIKINFGGYASYTISTPETDANGYGTFEYAPPSGYYALCSKNLAEFG